MKKMDVYFICVDAGGTSTKITCYRPNGEKIYQKRFGIGSPAVVKDLAFSTIEEALDEVIQETKKFGKLAVIQMGVSGLSVAPNVDLLEKRFSEKYDCIVSIENDAIEALFSVITTSAPLDKPNVYEDGLVIVAGTGSAICGYHAGKTHLVAGWGQLLGERGSAYAAVHQAALNIIYKSEHGIPLSVFDKALLSHLGLVDEFGLKSYFYHNNKATIASNALYIKQLAESSEDARLALYNEGVQLGELVVCLDNLLKFPNGVKLGLKGGFVLDSPIVVAGIKETLQKHNLSYNFMIDDTDPIIGAYYLALEKYKQSF